MLLAEATVETGIPFTAAVPFEGQESRWPASSQTRFHELLEKAAEVVIVSPGGYSADKMDIRNRWMVDHCTELAALWDGSPSGTANCVNYARSVDRRVFQLWARWLQFV